MSPPEPNSWLSNKGRYAVHTVCPKLNIINPASSVWQIQDITDTSWQELMECTFKTGRPGTEDHLKSCYSYYIAFVVDDACSLQHFGSQVPLSTGVSAAAGASAAAAALAVAAAWPSWAVRG